MSSSEDEIPFDFDQIFGNKNKNHRHQTKEDREYGIWADENVSENQFKKSKAFKNQQMNDHYDSSDDEMLMRTGFSLNLASTDKLAKKNFTAKGGKSKFINFVSGGIKAASLKKDVQIVYDPKEEEEKKRKAQEK